LSESDADLVRLAFRGFCRSLTRTRDQIRAPELDHPGQAWQSAVMTEKPIDSLSGSILAGLACVCPRCGKGKMFQGFLTLRPRCEVCGLDYGFADSGDGPAVFVMFLAGFIVVGAALVTEVVYKPPFWVHAVLWLPLILVVTLGPLRPMKGLMIALQYHHKAAEGRFGGERP
jgi:uncharacterized protein (DUF983 family)